VKKLLKRGDRKAQITLFVILALVILIVVAILYFVLKKPASIGDEFKEEAVPEEFKPVRDYVEGCIHQVGIEAIKLMGAHGGYIDPLDPFLTPLQMRFSVLSPTHYELVSLTGEPEDAVPYYLHVPGKSDYLNFDYKSLAPSIESMEFQLNMYISRNLPDCVGGFDSLEESYDVVADNDNIITSSFIREDEIEFFVRYEIEVTKGTTKTTITKYTDVLKFPYKKYHDLALTMLMAEFLSQFSESFTISLINYYSGMDINMLPPVLEYTELPYIMTWSKSKAKLDMNGLLLSNIPALQVKDTRGFELIEPSGVQIEDAFYNSLTMDVLNTSVPDLSDIAINFYYVDNSLDMYVQPSKGDIIRPSVEMQKGNQYVPDSVFNTYRFSYDVAYPLFVEIRGLEPTTEIPEYSFMFALESNLIENKPALAWQLGMGTVEWDDSYINTTLSYPAGSYTDSSGNPIDVKPRIITKSLFCDEDTWISGNVSIRVVDVDGNVPLDGAIVTYGCGNYDECWAGTTELVHNGQFAEWSSTLPICQGGYLSITKEGYGSKSIQLSTEENRNIIIPTQKIHKIREINATLKKVEVLKNIYREDWDWMSDLATISGLQDIDSDSEQVILSITQIGFDAGVNPVSNTLIFGKEGVEKSTIKLVPGDYEITGQLIDYNGIMISANCSRFCKANVLICLDFEYIPSEEINMTPAPWGGLQIKEMVLGGDPATGVFKITADDLDNNNGLEFRVLKLPDLQKTTPPGGCLHNLGEMNNVSDYSVMFKSDIWPVFK